MFSIHNQLFQGLYLAKIQYFCPRWLLKLVQGSGKVAHRPITLQDFFSAPVKVLKSLIHYGQTVGLVEYISISLTAVKGPNGTDMVMVSHTLPIFKRFPVLTWETVVVFWADARDTAWVALLTLVCVFIAIEPSRTHWYTPSLWAKNVFYFHPSIFTICWRNIFHILYGKAVNTFSTTVLTHGRVSPVRKRSVSHQ